MKYTRFETERNNKVYRFGKLGWMDDACRPVPSFEQNELDSIFLKKASQSTCEPYDSDNLVKCVQLARKSNRREFAFALIRLSTRGKQREPWEIRRYLMKCQISNLYYMTEIDNVPSILERGILSYHAVNQIHGLGHKNFSLDGVQNRRKYVILENGENLHNYVPLHFTTHTPMQYIITHSAFTRGRERKSSKESLAFLEVNAFKVFQENEVYFSDGNAASDGTEFYNDIDGLDKLNWEVIRSPNGYPQCYDREWKREKSSEVLVPGNISPKLIDRIVVYCEESKAELLNKLRSHCKMLKTKHHNLYYNYLLNYEIQSKRSYYDDEQ